MAIRRAAACGVSPEGVGNMSEHTKSHGVRHAWARRCREVNDHPDEDRMVNTPVAYQKIQP